MADSSYIHDMMKAILPFGIKVVAALRNLVITIPDFVTALLKRKGNIFYRSSRVHYTDYRWKKKYAHCLEVQPLALRRGC